MDYKVHFSFLGVILLTSGALVLGERFDMIIFYNVIVDVLYFK